jgi:hypothetical protein
MAGRYGTEVYIRNLSVPSPHSATTVGGDHTFRHIEKKYTCTTNEIRGRTDCCEELAGQTVKRNQPSGIIVVLLSNYLKCVQ